MLWRNHAAPSPPGHAGSDRRNRSPVRDQCRPRELPCSFRQCSSDVGANPAGAAQVGLLWSDSKPAGGIRRVATVTRPGCLTARVRGVGNRINCTSKTEEVARALCTAPRLDCHTSAPPLCRIHSRERPSADLGSHLIRRTWTCMRDRQGGIGQFPHRWGAPNSAISRLIIDAIHLVAAIPRPPWRPTSLSAGSKAHCGPSRPGLTAHRAAPLCPTRRE